MNMSVSRQRSLMLFEESIRSKYTRQNYTSNLNRFLKFAKMDHCQILSAPRPKLQRILEDYVMDLKRSANPNSIPSMFRGIKHFCVMNQIDLNWAILYKMFPPRQKAPSLRAYTAKEIKNLLSCAKSPRNKAIIHFLASTGARIGVFEHDLLVGHTRIMPNGCMAVLLYAGHVEEYWAFLTPQASRALKRYHDHRRKNGEIFCESTPVFVASDNTSRQLGWSGARSVIYRTISKSSITRHKQGSRYNVQADHGFRKRFNTILKLDNSMNYNVAEKLMGHKNGLDGVYLTPTIDELFAEFKKVIHKIEI